MKDPSAKPVLVGCDFSACSDEALLQADAWARRNGQDLVVAHAFPDPAHAGALFPAMPHTTIDRAEVAARLRDAIRARVVERTGRSAGGFEVVVGTGTGHRLLIAEAERWGADPLVVGATGRGRVTRALFGTTAEHVVRHASTSVLVARREAGSGIVMVATDLSDSSLVAVRAAAAEARAREARLVAVHAVAHTDAELASLDPALGVWDFATLAMMRERATRQLESQLASCGADADVVVVDGDARTALVQATTERRADVMVVATHGRSGFARLALGSVAAAVTRKAPCSVLVVRASPKA